MSKVERIAEAHRQRSDRLYKQPVKSPGVLLSYRLKGRPMPKGYSVGIIGFMIRKKRSAEQ